MQTKAQKSVFSQSVSGPGRRVIYRRGRGSPAASPFPANAPNVGTHVPRERDLARGTTRHSGFGRESVLVHQGSPVLESGRAPINEVTGLLYHLSYICIQAGGRLSARWWLGLGVISSWESLGNGVSLGRCNLEPGCEAAGDLRFGSVSRFTEAR